MILKLQFTIIICELCWIIFQHLSITVNCSIVGRSHESDKFTSWEKYSNFNAKCIAISYLHWLCFFLQLVCLIVVLQKFSWMNIWNSLFSSCVFYAFFGILSVYVSLASLHTVDIDNQTGTSRKWVFTKKHSCCKLKLLHARQDGSLLHVWSNNHWSYIFFSENTMGDLTFLWPELPRDWKHNNGT